MLSQPLDDPRLNDLGFHLMLPGRLLRPYVHSYWVFRRTIPLATYHEQFMHPRGGFGIVFNFGDQLHLDSQALTEPVFLDGVNTISRKMGFFGNVELMGIRFYEGGAYPFLALPLAELSNETALLDALPALLRLYARLYEAESLTARIELLDEWLLARLTLGKERDERIPASLALLRAEGIAIPELAGRLAISQRQLERLYQNQVGISPKQYTQLCRIEAVRLALKHLALNPADSKPNLATFASDLEYYDQSHFIREFRAVVGMTPSGYIRHSQRRNSSTP